MPWSNDIIPWEECDSYRRTVLRTVWKFGDLRYKLDPDQRETYEAMIDYFARQKTSYDRLWVNEWARRRGKDYMTWCFVRSRMRLKKNISTTTGLHSRGTLT